MVSADLIVMTTLWVRLRATRAQLAAELESERSAHAQVRRSSERLETRMRTLRSELAESHHTNAELTTRIGRTNPAEAGRALGLWALERHRQARAAGTPLLGFAVGPGMDLTAGLTEAIRIELEVLREDVGTHAELGSMDLGSGTDAREALTILRVVQELTAALAKRADEIEVRIGREDATAVVTVAALGWADAPPNTAAFETALAALGGELDLRPDADTPDTLLAIVRLGSADTG